MHIPARLAIHTEILETVTRNPFPLLFRTTIHETKSVYPFTTFHSLVINLKLQYKELISSLLSPEYVESLIIAFVMREIEPSHAQHHSIKAVMKSNTLRLSPFYYQVYHAESVSLPSVYMNQESSLLFNTFEFNYIETLGLLRGI